MFGAVEVKKKLFMMSQKEREKRKEIFRVAFSDSIFFELCLINRVVYLVLNQSKAF